MDRTTLHLDLDTLYVSVEPLIDSRLEHSPHLVGGISDRGVVDACSYETRTFGVCPGMPMNMEGAMSRSCRDPRQCGHLQQVFRYGHRGDQGEGACL